MFGLPSCILGYQVISPCPDRGDEIYRGRLAPLKFLLDPWRSRKVLSYKVSYGGPPSSHYPPISKDVDSGPPGNHALRCAVDARLRQGLV